MPSPKELQNILNDIELDTKLLYETYSIEKINDAIRYAKDLKDRYTCLWLYYDLFGTEEI